MSFNLNIKWPANFERFAKILDLSSLPIFDFIPFGCVVEQSDYFYSLAGVTMFPIILSMMLGLVVAVAQIMAASQNQSAHETYETCKNIFLLVTYLVMPPVSAKVFHVWACRSFDTADATEGGESEVESYLVVDMGIDCDSERYHHMQAYAIAMVLVYPVGIPLLYATLLFR